MLLNIVTGSVKCNDCL